MGQAHITGATIDAPTLEFFQRERAKALTTREWRFRLAGYGYAIRDVEGAQIVTLLPKGTELGVLPAQGF
ncbi:MAG: hypothetical protein CML68_24630 [Rhodobacteraceae bacterium]|nr:hypothetical protein [Paracoccaceae bacterium]